MKLNALIITLIGFALFVAYKRDFKRGIAWTVFLLTLLPVELSVQVGNVLPVISCHRVIILISLYFYFRNRGNIKSSGIGAAGNVVALLVLANSFSFLLSANHSVSLKPYVGFLIEYVILFWVLGKSIEESDILPVFKSIAFATLIVALITLVERYTKFNPVDYLSIPPSAIDYRNSPANYNIVYSTYTHPILLGTGLGMGLPFEVFLTRSLAGVSRNLRRIMVLGSLATIVSIYLTFSRGPWIALGAVTVIYIFLGYRRYKKHIAILFLSTTLILVFRPGVVDTITSFYKNTIDVTSAEGKSFQYRLDLWRVSFEYALKSPKTMLFGYGQKTSSYVGVAGRTAFGHGNFRKISSWDNQLAKYLFELGFIGLLSYLVFYAKMLLLSLRLCRTEHEYKYHGLTLLSSAAIYVIMSTNVSLFAPQVHFIFLVCLACAAYLTGK